MQHRQEPIDRHLLTPSGLGLLQKPSKCEFHQTETEYLGFIISQEGIKVDPVKTKAIRTCAKATRKKEIQSFVGFCNFYRRFIEGCTKIAKPLYQLTEKDKKWEFGEKQQRAFESLIYKVTHAPILAHYDPKNGSDHRNRCLKVCHGRNNILNRRR